MLERIRASIEKVRRDQTLPRKSESGLSRGAGQKKIGHPGGRENSPKSMLRFAITLRQKASARAVRVGEPPGGDAGLKSQWVPVPIIVRARAKRGFRSDTGAKPPNTDAPDLNRQGALQATKLPRRCSVASDHNTPQRNRTVAFGGNKRISMLSPPCAISAVALAVLAAKNIIDANRVQKDHRQNNDASIENETKRSIRCGGVSHGDGIGHHIGPEHHPKRRV